MALTLAARIQIARDSTHPFTSQVAGALVKHAKWILRTEGQSTESETLARNALNNPDTSTWRFGASLLTEPTYDDLGDVATLTDQQVQDTISELWPLFVSITT